MKSLPLVLLLALGFGDSIHKVAKINTYSAEAAEAYRAKDYFRAMTAYEYLLEDLRLQDDRLRLNLAHAYFQAGAQEKARNTYQLLARHMDPSLRSVACQQLGTLHAFEKDWGPALDFFRQALLANPANQPARHNYELLKKYLLLNPHEQPAPEPEVPSPADAPTAPAPGAGQTGRPEKEQGSASPNQNQNGTEGQEENLGGNPLAGGEPNSRQESPAGTEQDTPEGQEMGEELGRRSAGGQTPPAADPDKKGSLEAITDKDQRAQTIHQRLRQINLSPEKAEMLLEALRHNELQHVQQLPRQPTRPREKGKPEW